MGLFDDIDENILIEWIKYGLKTGKDMTTNDPYLKKLILKVKKDNK